MMGFGFFFTIACLWILGRLLIPRRPSRIKPGAKGQHNRFIDVSVQSPDKRTREFFSKVVGVSFKNADGTSRQRLISTTCQKGQELVLMREPENPKDPEAIAVMAPAGQIGYLEKSRLASDISRHLRNGISVTAEVAQLTGGTKDKPTIGVNIKIHIHR